MGYKYNDKDFEFIYSVLKPYIDNNINELSKRGKSKEIKQKVRLEIKEKDFEFYKKFISKKTNMPSSLVMSIGNCIDMFQGKKLSYSGVEEVEIYCKNLSRDYPDKKSIFEKSRDEYLNGKNNKINLNNLTKEDILLAFDIYDELEKNDNLNKNRQAEKWFVVNKNNSKKYDAKFIVGIAYSKKYSLTTELSSKNYTSEMARNCLNRLGFDTIDETIVESSENKDEKMDEKISLNQILFGSPGTGKTYNTINKALEIILEKEPNYETSNILAKENHTKKEREFLRKRFEEYKQKGQIEFITFHQSFGYEEFMEGIKAIPVGKKGNENNEEMIYDVVDGVFKKFCDNAKNNFELSQEKNTFSMDAKFDVLWKKLKIFLINEIDMKEKYFLSEQVYIFDVQDKRLKYKGDNWFRHDKGLNIKYENIKAMYLAGVKDRRTIKDIENVESLAKQHATYNLAVLDKIYEIEKTTNFIKETQERKNYIFIIDEINRGNISKIFGELITLIEEDKRIGKKEEMKVKLPYSNEEFGVPSNVYIIGTMNTADRSIAPIDTALRRRFEFVEMMPRYDIESLGENVDGINLQKLLEAINVRIEYLYDRDHLIGHAYLLHVKDLEGLKQVFKNKIIPLLAEYFYEDWENIDLILNKNYFIKEKTINANYSIKSGKFNDKKMYEITKDKFWKISNFQRIYDDSIKNENLQKQYDEDLKLDNEQQ
ncbi:MAG: McrB family protein [Campylobacteraceae bacterium]